MPFVSLVEFFFGSLHVEHVLFGYRRARPISMAHQGRRSLLTGDQQDASSQSTSFTAWNAQSLVKKAALLDAVPSHAPRTILQWVVEAPPPSFPE